MAEYTPTDNEARALYAAGVLGGRTDMTTTEPLAEFDRWLAEHDARLLREVAQSVLNDQNWRLSGERLRDRADRIEAGEQP